MMARRHANSLGTLGLSSVSLTPSWMEQVESETQEQKEAEARRATSLVENRDDMLHSN
jgi:hypothetical protein